MPKKEFLKTKSERKKANKKLKGNRKKFLNNPQTWLKEQTKGGMTNA